MHGESARQKELYEAIHDDYEDHYYDQESTRYRERFYYGPLFEGLDLNGRSVADICSGSGHNSLALLKRFPRAEVVGFDISSAACQDYRRKVGRPAHEADLTKPFSLDQKFDVAMVVGGLHHCSVDLSRTLANIADLLKPGGVFLLLEPNREFVLEGARKLWYRMDRYFDADTESALAHTDLIAQAAGRFTADTVRYFGGPGYFLISQSLLFRMPKSLKRGISAPLMSVEALVNRVPARWLHPYFIARWVRTGV
jgi:SAM-dependent methyltransferase